MIEAREDFYDFMLLHGIPEADIRSMTDTEFQMTLNALLDENSPRALYQQARPTRQTPGGNQYQGTTLPDGFGNGSFDEDEAYKRAIEASLDDMLIAPHLRPKPSPQNEVGVHHRPSSNINSQTNTNYRYRNEPANYPPRPNPKPTPLPSTKTRTSEYSKYTPKERAPSCSHPRLNPSQYTASQATKKTNASGTSSKPQTKARPTTTNNHDLVVTNAKPKVSSNSPIAGTTTKKTQKTTTTASRQPTSTASSGTRQPTKSTTKTTATTTKKAPGTSTRTTATPKSTTRTPTTTTRTPTTTTRTTTTTKTTTTTRKTNTQSGSQDHSTRTFASIAAADTILHTNRQSTNTTPRGTRTSQKGTTNKVSSRGSTRNADNTNNVQHKHIHDVNPTFLNEAIADPTPEILHPKHHVEDQYDLIDHPPISRPTNTKTNTKSKPPPPPQPEPQPPRREEKPPETRFSESQILRNIQDMEFIMATQEAERKEREEEEKKAHEEMLIRQEKAKKENQLDEAKRLFKSIPPEPQNGVKAVTIAVQMPNAKRVMRKFTPDTKGLHVYAWVSGQTLELPDDEKLFVESFELLQAMGQATELDKNKTLEEQKISGKVLLYVSN